MIFVTCLCTLSYNVIFRNDYDLLLLVGTRPVKAVLVDHHALSNADRFLSAYVTEIIDHRPIDNSTWTYRDDVRSTIAIVGSCCTLVAQRIKDLGALVARDVDFFNTYPVCSSMLYSKCVRASSSFPYPSKAIQHVFII
jgi:hypothetical protein